MRGKKSVPVNFFYNNQSQDDDDGPLSHTDSYDSASSEDQHGEDVKYLQED